MSFHVGQLVECIDAGPGYATGQPIELAQNAIYRIRDIGGMSGNLVNVGTIHYYAPERFRALVDDRRSVAFTIGADPDSEHWDNRKKIKERT